MVLGKNREAGAVAQPRSCLLGPHPRLKLPASDFVYLFFIIEVIVHVIDYLEIAVRSKQK